jgi:hypothetical protein
MQPHTLALTFGGVSVYLFDDVACQCQDPFRQGFVPTGSGTQPPGTGLVGLRMRSDLAPPPLTMNERKMAMRLARSAIVAGLLSAASAGISFGQSGYGSTFAADVAFPVSSFSKSFKTGYGGHIDFYMQNDDYLRISFFLGYTRWTIDNTAINQQYASMGGKGTYQLDGGVGAFPVLIGAKLLTPTGWFRFYGFVEAGVYLYSGKVNGKKTENGIVTEDVFRDLSKSVGAANFGAGLLIAITRELFLDLGGRYHVVKTNVYNSFDFPGSPSAIATNRYFSFFLGLTWSYPPLEGS